jgi:hypothetical protein
MTLATQTDTSAQLEGRVVNQALIFPDPGAGGLDMPIQTVGIEGAVRRHAFR